MTKSPHPSGAEPVCQVLLEKDEAELCHQFLLFCRSASTEL